MTVTTTNRFVEYTGNGSTTQFAYAFNIPDADSARVQLVEIATNVVTELSTSQYTITGLGSDAGGEVTYPTSGDPLASTHQIQIYRRTEPTQQRSVNNQTAYDAGVVEEVWDRLTRALQDAYALGDRALKVRENQTGPSMTVGTDGQVLIFNSSGNIEGGPDGSDIAGAQAAADTAVAARDATQLLFNDFDTRYLGSKTSDPTLDNQGGALADGALYFNTTTNRMRVYDLGGTQWGDAADGALLASSNLSDLADAGTARTNLGVGTSLQSRTVITSTASATYTPPAGVKALRVRGIGGGGGGGGTDGQGAGTGAAGGGGGAGGYFDHLITTPAASYTVQAGAAGTGGAAGNNNGTAGGDTTFTDGTLTLTGGGGAAGLGMLGTASGGFGTGGAGGTASGGDLNVTGSRGRNGHVVSGDISERGDTASTIWAAAVFAPLTSNIGIFATGFGAGGTGSLALDTATNYQGGNGAPGQIIVDEYF